MITEQDLKNIKTRLVVFVQDNERVEIVSLDHFVSLRGHLGFGYTISLELEAEYQDELFVSYVILSERELLHNSSAVQKLAKDKARYLLLKKLNEEENQPA